MITKAALILLRGPKGRREIMFVRGDKPFWVFPGGKQDPGETVEQALRRELQEELACESSDCHELGVVRGHTPDGRAITMHLYSANLIGTPTPSAEIKEIAWMDESGIEAAGDAMTPMTLRIVLPYLKAQGLL